MVYSRAEEEGADADWAEGQAEQGDGGGPLKRGKAKGKQSRKDELGVDSKDELVVEDEAEEEKANSSSPAKGAGSGSKARLSTGRRFSTDRRRSTTASATVTSGTGGRRGDKEQSSTLSDQSDEEKRARGTTSAASKRKRTSLDQDTAPSKTRGKRAVDEDSVDENTVSLKYPLETGVMYLLWM